MIFPSFLLLPCWGFEPVLFNLLPLGVVGSLRAELEYVTMTSTSVFGSGHQTEDASPRDGFEV